MSGDHLDAVLAKMHTQVGNAVTSQLSGHGRTENKAGDGSSGTGQPTGHPTDKE